MGLSYVTPLPKTASNGVITPENSLIKEK